MALPTMDGKATDFNMIPAYTAAWPSGNGTVAPFNTPGTGSPFGATNQGIVTIDTVKAPDDEPAQPVRKRTRKTSTRK
jgi:hypothetical protein